MLSASEQIYYLLEALVYDKNEAPPRKVTTNESAAVFVVLKMLEDFINLEQSNDSEREEED
jgi:hypothetical protein